MIEYDSILAGSSISSHTLKCVKSNMFRANVPLCTSSLCWFNPARVRISQVTQITSASICASFAQSPPLEWRNRCINCTTARNTLAFFGQKNNSKVSMCKGMFFVDPPLPTVKQTSLSGRICAAAHEPQRHGHREPEQRSTHPW